MKLKLTTLLFLFICIFSSTAQDIENEPNTLKKQFDDLYRKSTSYQVYKVISKEKYQQLKQNVLDSIQTLESEVSKANNVINQNKIEIDKTKQELDLTKQNLSNSISRENSIDFLGMQLSKSTYNLILWSIIILLVAALGYFIFKFFRSNVLTKEAQDNLLEVEQEFETHRKKSLEREQKLRRQLQDEINKQRNS